MAKGFGRRQSLKLSIFCLSAVFFGLCFYRRENKKSALRALFLFQAFFIRNGEFVATFCTAAGQYFTAFLGAHACAEAVLVGAFATRGLKCPFHRCFGLICSVQHVLGGPAAPTPRVAVFCAKVKFF